jgi:hypothetical protein
MNTKIFQNAWNLQQLPVTMKLPSLEWRFLLCCDGKTPVYQIQRRLELADKDRDYILNRLCASGLLNEKSLSLEELAQTVIDNPAPQAEAQTFSEFLQAAATTPPSAEAPSSAPGKTAPAFSPLPKPAVVVPTIRCMSLQSVIQFILNQKADPTAGHLATYQVFMGINTQLLKRNGITSLRFQDDRFITDTELQNAIADNIQKVLKIVCPEEVYFNQPVSGKK